MVEDVEKTQEVLEKVEDAKEESPVEETKEKAPEEKKTKKSTSKKAKETVAKAEKKEVAPKKETKPKAEKKAEAPKKTKKAAAPKKEKTPAKATEDKTEKTESVEAPVEEKKEDEKVAPPVEEKKVEEEVVAAPEEDVKEVEGAPEEGSKEEEKKPRSRKSKKEEGPFPEELIFGKYNTSDVVVEDPSLKAHINLDPAYVPHSSARHANKPFHKAKISIVERLVNSIMRTERYTGKKTKSYKAVLEAFEIITNKTKENPVQILVKAIENSAPREEVTRLKFGGISVPKAVDAGPSRRLDIALRNISVGSVRSTHKNRKSIAVCLANELLAAANGDIQSYAVSKRDEVERVAKSAH